MLRACAAGGARSSTTCSPRSHAPAGADAGDRAAASVDLDRALRTCIEPRAAESPTSPAARTGSAMRWCTRPCSPTSCPGELHRLHRGYAEVDAGGTAGRADRHGHLRGDQGWSRLAHHSAAAGDYDAALAAAVRAGRAAEVAFAGARGPPLPRVERAPVGPCDRTEAMPAGCDRTELLAADGRRRQSRRGLITAGAHAGRRGARHPGRPPPTRVAPDCSTSAAAGTLYRSGRDRRRPWPPTSWPSAVCPGRPPGPARARVVQAHAHALVRVGPQRRGPPTGRGGDRARPRRRRHGRRGPGPPRARPGAGHRRAHRRRRRPRCTRRGRSPPSWATSRRWRARTSTCGARWSRRARWRAGRPRAGVRRTCLVGWRRPGTDAPWARSGPRRCTSSAEWDEADHLLGDDGPAAGGDVGGAHRGDPHPRVRRPSPSTGATTTSAHDELEVGTAWCHQVGDGRLKACSTGPWPSWPCGRVATTTPAREVDTGLDPLAHTGDPELAARIAAVGCAPRPTAPTPPPEPGAAGRVTSARFFPGGRAFYLVERLDGWPAAARARPRHPTTTRRPPRCAPVGPRPPA